MRYVFLDEDQTTDHSFRNHSDGHLLMNIHRYNIQSIFAHRVSSMNRSDALNEEQAARVDVCVCSRW